MNGRVYDPTLGRFIQADPHIQAPSDSQSLNRYSYVKNNPLSYTDPTGFFFKKLWNKVRPFVGIIVGALMTAYCGPHCGAGIYKAIVIGAAAGAAGAAANGGNILKGAAWGAFSAAAFYGVGEAFGHQTLSVGSVAAHGFTGGVMSVLQGGKFGHGFLSAGVTKGFSKAIGTFKTFGSRVFAAAIVGGTASKLGGGKFANGAITGAFSRMFNDEAGPDYEEYEDAELGVDVEVSIEAAGQKVVGVKLDTDNPNAGSLEGPELNLDVGAYDRKGNKMGVGVSVDENGFTEARVNAKVLSANVSVDDERIRVGGGACAVAVCGEVGVKGNPNAVMRNGGRLIRNLDKMATPYPVRQGTMFESWKADIYKFFGVPQI